jgi:hypothetical protein
MEFAHPEVRALRIAVRTRETGLISLKMRHARERAKKEQDLKVIRAELVEAEKAAGLR